MADNQETVEGATPEAVDSKEAGATPAEQGPEVASGVTPPTGGSGLDSALRREREARKAAETELKRLRSQATDAETLAQRVAELEQAKADAERRTLLLKVANEYSIPPVLSDRLHGETEDELRADAEALLKAIPVQAPAPPQQTVGGPQGAPTASRSPEEWLSVLRGKR
jgi:hypothetical protein